MMKLYVLFDAEEVLYRVSNIHGTGIVVNCNIPIDFNKLQGYEIVDSELIFNESKYNAYLKLEKEKEEYEQAMKEFEEYSKENILPNLSDREAYEFKLLYPTFKVGVEYKVDDRITYDNKFYKVLIGHKSQADWTPNVAHSLFQEVK